MSFCLNLGFLSQLGGLNRFFASSLGITVANFVSIATYDGRTVIRLQGFHELDIRLLGDITSLECPSMGSVLKFLFHIFILLTGCECKNEEKTSYMTYS